MRVLTGGDMDAPLLVISGADLPVSGVYNTSGPLSSKNVRVYFNCIVPLKW